MRRSRSKRNSWWIWISLLLLFLLTTFLVGAYYESNEYFGNLRVERHYEESIRGTTLVVHAIYPQQIVFDTTTPERLVIWITDSSHSYKDRFAVSISSVNDLMLSIDKDTPQWTSTLPLSVLPNGNPVKVLVKPFTLSKQVDGDQVLEIELVDFSGVSLPQLSIKLETYNKARTRFVFSKVWEQISIPIGILIAVIGWLISQNDQARQNKRERVTSQLVDLKNFPDKISSEFVDKLKAAHEESNQWDSDLQSDLTQLEEDVLDDGYEFLGRYIDEKRRGDKRAAAEALFNLWDKTGIISREVVISGLQSLGSFHDVTSSVVTPKDLAIFRDYRLQNIVKPLYTLENFPKEAQFKNDPSWSNFNLNIGESFRTWLEREKLFIELDGGQILYPFADLQSPYYGEAKLLQQSWLPPTDWESIGSPIHTAITAISNWDLQAGLYSYLSNVRANTLDKTFFVQVRLGRQTKKQGVDFVLEALADEWVALLTGSNPLVLFEMPEPKQITLVRFLTWIAGGEHDLRAWLLQVGQARSGDSKNLAKSLELTRSRLLELSGENSTPVPSSLEKRAWLSLRPEGLVQTNLIVLCSHILGIEDESKRSTSTLQSHTLVELSTMLSSLHIYLKIFSTDDDLPNVLLASFHELKLKWNADQLSQICRQRINYCSSKKVGGLDELIWPPSAESYDKKLAQEAAGSMKNLVSMGNLQLQNFARGGR